MQKIVTLFTALTLFSLTLPLPAAFGASPDNSRALLGVKSGKAIFDINLSQPEALPLYLSVIQETQDDLVKAGLKPELLLAFRGAAVTLVSTDRSRFSPAQQQALASAEPLLADLQKSGVRMEACAVAMRLFKVDNSTILPGILVVGNTFVSAIGYQQQGFAMITLQ